MTMVVSVSQIAGPAVNSALSVVNSFAKDKFHEILGVQNEIDSLSSNLTAMQAALKDGEKFLKDSDSESLLDWLTKLRSVSLDVEDVVATYATDTALWSKRGFPNPISWLCFKSKAANKIREITRMIDRISKEKDRFHFGGGHYASSSQTTWVGLRETTPSHDTHIFGRETEKEDIVGWLQSDEYNPEGDFPVVAITGMGGLGKTTLAQLVYNDERIHRKEDKTGYFKHAVWINVSGSFNVDRILKEMAEILTKMAHNLIFTEAIKEHIRRTLEGRLLLVLDDVWPTDLDWKPLHDFLKSCPQGSKVVVTSRDAKVPSIMRAKHTKTLGILPREECWNLFAAEAFTSGEHPTELEMIGREIISKCDFLPLAVKSMASLLRGDTNKNRWERILKDGVWESDQPLLGNQKSNILPALKLSYDGLPSQLKQCFAYCCIFPKGYMFEEKELVNLWIAEGYIEARRSYKIEEVGRYYFDELQARSFFQLLDIDNKTRYNIHDLNHDLAIYVSSNCQQVTEDEASPIASETRHLSFLGKDAQKLARGIRNAQKLRTLLLPTPHAKDFSQALDKMFRSLSYLRVLDLSSSTIQALPESIQELKLLSYLDLSRTEIRALPNTICNLHNLQILKLLQCLWLWSLPKDFGNLKNLRHLELDDMFWYKCTAFPPRIGCIANLHDLHAFHVRKESGYGVEQLQFLKNLEGVLHISSLENSEDAMSAKLKEKTSISGLVLEWSNKDAQPQESSMQERVLNQLEPHPGVRKLEINHFKGNQFPIWMGTLGNLRELSLNHCVNCSVLSLGPLPHLRALRVKGMLRLVDWPDITYISLIELSISNCPQLRVLPRKFPNLWTAKIKQCDALTALPQMPSLRFLRLINNVLLERWGKTRMRMVRRNGTVEQASERSVSFQPVLLELRIIGCPRLQQLPVIFSPQKLVVSGCASLRSLPNPQCCQRLQCLEVDNCIGPSLIEALPSTSSLDSLVISNIVNMHSLPEFPRLPGLRNLYIDNCQDLRSLFSADGWAERLPSLKFLSISGCPKLEVFPVKGLPTSVECLSITNCYTLQAFHPGNCLASLTSLEDLSLEDCPELSYFPEDGLPPNLKHLRIQGCPLLAQKCSEEAGGKYWPIIRSIADLDIDFIRNPEPLAPEKGLCGCITFFTEWI